MKDQAEEPLLLDVSQDEQRELCELSSGEQNPCSKEVLCTLMKLYLSAAHGLFVSFCGKTSNIRTASRRSWILRRILCGSFFLDVYSVLEDIGYPLEQIQTLISPEKQGPLTGVLDTEVSPEQESLIMKKCARFTNNILENYGTLKQHKIERGVGIQKIPINEMLDCLENQDVLNIVTVLEKVNLKNPAFQTLNKEEILQQSLGFNIRYMRTEKSREKVWPRPVNFRDYWLNKEEKEVRLSDSESETEAPAPLKKLYIPTKPRTPSPRKPRTPIPPRRHNRSPSPTRRVIERRRRSPRRSPYISRKKSPIRDNHRRYDANRTKKTEDIRSLTSTQEKKAEEHCTSVKEDMKKMRLLLKELKEEVLELKKMMTPTVNLSFNPQDPGYPPTVSYNNPVHVPYVQNVQYPQTVQTSVPYQAPVNPVVPMPTGHFR